MHCDTCKKPTEWGNVFSGTHSQADHIKITPENGKIVSVCKECLLKNKGIYFLSNKIKIYTYYGHTG